MHYPIFTANEENRFFSNFNSITFTSITFPFFHFSFCNFPESFTKWEAKKQNSGKQKESFPIFMSNSEKLYVSQIYKTNYFLGDNKLVKFLRISHFFCTGSSKKHENDMQSLYHQDLRVSYSGASRQIWKLCVLASQTHMNVQLLQTYNLKTNYI